MVLALLNAAVEETDLEVVVNATLEDGLGLCALDFGYLIAVANLNHGLVIACHALLESNITHTVAVFCGHADADSLDKTLVGEVAVSAAVGDTDVH